MVLITTNSIHNGKMYSSKTWNALINNCIDNKSALHFIGLLSDGNVHSNIAHLKSMLKRAKVLGIAKVRIHILLDGRDVEAVSADKYIIDLEDYLYDLKNRDFDCRIASGGGRMRITMDRYEANWDMVKLGWQTHVLGIGRQFTSALQAVDIYREELGVIDQEKSKENNIPKAKTSHTLNPVPFIIYDGVEKRSIKQESFGLALGLEIPMMWEESILLHR